MKSILYKNKLYDTDVIEYVGLTEHGELLFKYPQDKSLLNENEEVKFSISQSTLDKYYVKIN